MRISESLTTEAGTFELCLSTDWRMHGQAVAQLAQRWDSRRSGERVRVLECDTVQKGGPLSLSGARRHRLRRTLLGRSAPAAEEYYQLEWLRDRLFQVPRPLACAVLYSGTWGHRFRRPLRQLLITEEVPGAVPLDAALKGADPAAQLRWSRELGRELGRMHALRFLHADLFPRNVLVSPRRAGDDGRELWFIDCWAGGPTAWRNGSLRRLESDLGAWLAEAGPWLDAPFLPAMLESYLGARESNGRPIDDEVRWLSRVEASRRKELRRRETQRYRLRGLPFPRAGVVLPTRSSDPRGL